MHHYRSNGIDNLQCCDHENEASVGDNAVPNSENLRLKGSAFQHKAKALLNTATSWSPDLCCPICRGLEWKEKLYVRNVSISQCDNCGLFTTTDFLTRDRKTETLYDSTPEQYGLYCRQYLPGRLRSYEIGIIKIERFRQLGNLLEIGSSFGFFLDMASRSGWNAVGVEISRYACEVAQSRGCRTYNCDIRNAPLGKESFDAIIMWDVIEHFPNPIEILRQCVRLLRHGGALFIKTPDARALNLFSSPIRYIYRNFVYPANTAEHVFHFTPESLSNLVREAGIGAIEVDLDSERGDWRTRVISGNNQIIRCIRWAVMRYAFARGWPYEFVLMAIKG
jgi:2-polyprenyl-3-methyl-5-hydroxy-6-metoxy-1,4-benzoquinol methylase